MRSMLVIAAIIGALTGGCKSPRRAEPQVRRSDITASRFSAIRDGTAISEIRRSCGEPTFVLPPSQKPSATVPASCLKDVREILVYYRGEKDPSYAIYVDSAQHVACKAEVFFGLAY